MSMNDDPPILLWTLTAVAALSAGFLYHQSTKSGGAEEACDAARVPIRRQGAHLRLVPRNELLQEVRAAEVGPRDACEKVVDLGPLRVEAERQRTVTLPPLIGGAAVVAGVVLVFIGARR